MIGITGNYDELACKLGRGYYDSVVRAGGVPVVIPPVADKHVLMSTLDRLDALMLSGGGDINPLWCGEEPVPGLHGINSERDLPELLITRLAYNRQLPMLGICRGIQTLAVASRRKGGQDIPISHHREALAGCRPLRTHTQRHIEAGSTLYNIYKEYAPHQFGGQRRHCTLLTSTPSTIRPSASPAHEVHNRVLTLDTHCDTPMFFPQGIHFDQRDPRILVDLHKMTEGRQDATIMVAYLPQPKIGETFSSKVAFDVMQTAGPKEYTDLIFDKIEDIVRHNSQYISLARTPGDLYENKRQGRKSIMLGIENGLALNGQLQNVRHFAERGVVYITLCHNGDNDLCDSAAAATPTTASAASASRSSAR